MKRVRNGGIGRGWHPEELPDEGQVVAEGLLKGLLDDVFKKIQENHIERMKDEKTKTLDL